MKNYTHILSFNKTAHRGGSSASVYERDNDDGLGRWTSNIDNSKIFNSKEAYDDHICRCYEDLRYSMIFVPDIDSLISI